MFGRGRIETKSDAELVLMRQAGLVVARTLQSLRDAAAPGVTTGELNDFAHERIREQGATSNFLGYHGFTGVICTSVNEEIVHGIPGDRVLRDGDVLSIDCGAIVDGWHGDAAITVEVGTVSDAAAELSRVTEAALWAGIAAMATGARVGDISHAIESSIDAAGDYGITEPFTGHGIGREMHMDPDVPNSGRAGRGPRLTEGVTLAIEPMVTLGSAQARILEDGWTAVTPDSVLAAHWEHTVARTGSGVWVLTAEDGGAARLGELGVPFGAL
ncbi:type I methionyl aminopeptidase [Aeromicrobium sp. YIM 150415]|uniref:type I methionyl aminopeptidase n=1 Tax=Aeromicrobium sp. YIM 150415 TaxID=2803912 RepID=UPI0019667F5E|nr:type I methionyl aminopeptidase [Aeromicrobium sp. YIM 150415]MBM9462075.1 type I methionyl aminopeptidase [Aeromicrobium sp. YIM 150415]